MRTAKINRKTKETEIEIELVLDGKGSGSVDTGVGFLDHMLSLFANRGLFDLKVKAKGDLQIDEHHTVEDVGIALGQAFSKALGDKAGIRRYGFSLTPMDEVLATVAVDISGRGMLTWNAEFKRERVGDLSTELLYDFFDAFARNCGTSLHMRLEYGRNEHHKAEALFKGFGMAMRTACEKDGQREGIPSTKGVIG
ncbi:MAG: imidazoleglycerol-phosphate dehydratase HisB [Candidatus Micrarchaeota archaeon]